jgi:hypothetical protein
MRVPQSIVQTIGVERQMPITSNNDIYSDRDGGLCALRSYLVSHVFFDISFRYVRVRLQYNTGRWNLPGLLVRNPEMTHKHVLCAMSKTAGWGNKVNFTTLDFPSALSIALDNEFYVKH